MIRLLNVVLALSLGAAGCALSAEPAVDEGVQTVESDLTRAGSRSGPLFEGVEKLPTGTDRQSGPHPQPWREGSTEEPAGSALRPANPCPGPQSEVQSTPSSSNK